MRFLMAALTLVTSLSLTSCLDSDNDYTNIMYARVGQYSTPFEPYFEGPDGTIYYPTASSVAAMEASYRYDMSEADLSLIYYKVIENGSHSSTGTETRAEQGTNTPRVYDIELTAAQAVDSEDAQVASSVNEVEEMSVSNAPIFSIKPLIADYNGTRESSAWFFGDEMIVIPVQWIMKEDVDLLDDHTFALTYVREENNTPSDTLTLYLTHDRGMDTETDESKLAYAARDKAFDIEAILAMYRSNNDGNNPRYVKVMMKMNNNEINVNDEKDPLEMPADWSEGATYQAYTSQR